MAYHDDLLAHAAGLLLVDPPTQPSLRRAVSSAYYAVFHLLISASAGNWNNGPARAALTRGYEHQLMKAASNRVLSSDFSTLTGDDAAAVADLRLIARAFVQLQEFRHFADYNLSRELEPIDARNQVLLAQKIFSLWPTIQSTQIAQDYLVSLLIRPRQP